MKKFSIIVLILVLTAFSLDAQTKSETKAYEKALKKETIKNYDSFLSKYPQSVYAAEIMKYRDELLFRAVDSTDVVAVEDFLAQHPDTPIEERVLDIIDNLNVTSITIDKAIATASRFIQGDFRAVGYKSHGIESVVALSIGSTSDTLYIISCLDNQWSIANEQIFDKVYFYSIPQESIFADDFSIVKIGRDRYLSFNYLNYCNNGKKVEYVANLANLENFSLSNALFYGNNLLKPSVRDDYKIEGQDPSSLSTGLVRPEEIYLKNLISSNERFVQISEEDLKVDNAIEWWYEKNPKAETTAKSLTFGLLEADNGLIKKYQSSSKESSDNYRAALFDYRGQTIICAYNTKSKEYSLVWCEPQVQNKNKDKLLNAIYFESGSTLVLFYYKGKTTFKIRVNLANKSIRR